MPEQPDLNLISIVSESKSSLTDIKQMHRRALIFATALGINCSRLLATYVEHCRSQSLLGPSASLEMEQDNFSYCVKTLMCVSIWLVLMEQEVEVPKELRRFALESMNLTDRLYGEPPAKQVMMDYDLTTGATGLEESVSFKICLRLNLGNTAPDALVKLQEMLKQARPAREVILLQCLTKPLDELDRMIVGDKEQGTSPG
jgi:hypothetical protein